MISVRPRSDERCACGLKLATKFDGTELWNPERLSGAVVVGSAWFPTAVLVELLWERVSTVTLAKPGRIVGDVFGTDRLDASDSGVLLLSTI